MVNKSIKKLKITVTNIKSVLVNDSKKLSKVKVTGKRLEYNKLQLLEREKKEENVEKMNPLDIISAFTQAPVPYCKKLSPGRTGHTSP